MFSPLKKICGAVCRVLSRGRPPYSFSSYSQKGEDMILRVMFQGQKRGFYVDVGAYHPEQFSNTYYFYRRGWHGINIDAMPGSMELFKKLRPGDINLEIGISDNKEELTYYAFNRPALNGFLSGDILEKRISDGLDTEIISTKKMQMLTLAEVLDEYMPPGQSIDFLNVDAEGMDYKVLKSNNWTKYRPRIVLVEDLGTDSIEEIFNSEINRFMTEQGYKLFAKAVDTAIYRLESE